MGEERDNFQSQEKNIMKIVYTMCIHGVRPAASGSVMAVGGREGHSLELLLQTQSST